MYKCCHCVYTVMPWTYQRPLDHLASKQGCHLHVNSAFVRIIGHQGQVSFRSWRMGSFVNKWNGDVSGPLTSIYSHYLDLAVALRLAVYTEGTSELQINSGLPELSTEQKSQLHRRSRRLGISPFRGLSDLDITRGNRSKAEELLHLKKKKKRNRLVKFIPF